MLEIIITAVTIIILLVVSSFFSGSETALTGASRTRIHELTKKNNERAKTAEWLFQRQGKMIGALLIGNNMVNILASALATAIAIKLFGATGVFWATLAMTLLVLIFAEVMPKTYALTHPDRFALAVAPAVKILLLTLRPFVWFIENCVRLILALFNINLNTHKDHEENEEALLGAIKLHDGGDPEHIQERRMLRSILDLDEMDVSAIMAHRSQVSMINIDDPLDDIMVTISNLPYTRIPVYQEKTENIVGMLNVKTVFHASLKTKDNNGKSFKIADIISEPWFIPDTTTLLDQLEAFQKRREHFAIVVDEYGSFEGIVTLEDILEQIVGEISDEHDKTLPGLKQIADKVYVVDGSLPIREVNRVLDWELPDDQADTIAGLVIREARIIPKAGQVFDYYGCRFEIMQRKRNQVTRIRISLSDPSENSETKEE